MDRVPCVKCGATILPATFERTGGLCMPCENARKRPVEPEGDDEEGLSITYTVSPSRGYTRVYVLDAEEGEPHSAFQSQEDLPNELRSVGPGCPAIHTDHPYQERPLSPASFADLKEMVDAMAVPILADFSGGFGGSLHWLRIKRGMTAIEFHWWLELPHQWACLAEIIETLTALFDESPE